MKNGKPNRVPDLMRDGTAIQEAMRQAVQDTVREHKLLGHPIVIWRDGKVVWVPPEEIQLADEKNGPATK